MVAREQLYRLIDELPEAELSAAQRYLEYLRDTEWDRFTSLLDNAPEDDEPTNQDDEFSAEEALCEYRSGGTVSLDEFERALRG